MPLRIVDHLATGEKRTEERNRRNDNGALGQSASTDRCPHRICNIVGPDTPRHKQAKGKHQKHDGAAVGSELPWLYPTSNSDLTKRRRLDHWFVTFFGQT